MPTVAKTQVPSAASSAILPLILVFLCGVTVGALTMSLGIHRTLHRIPTWSESSKPVTLERWKKELNLTDEQTRQMETILDDFSKYYDNVLADGNTRILQILNDEQKKKFEQMLKGVTR